MDILDVQDIGSIRKVTINNPRKKNALNRKAYVALANLLNDAAKDNKVKCLVLTGKDDFYSSGNDLTQDFGDYSDDGPQQNPILVMVEAFIKFPKLLVALVNGPAIGIAATTAALCDIVYCSENAYFYTPFTALGLCAEGSSSVTFPLIMGASKANELLILNQKLTAQEALRVGFVAQVYRHESEIWTKLSSIDGLPLGSIMSSKMLIRRPVIETLMRANEAEVEELAIRMESEEALQALINFQASKKSKL